jgi:two-component system nitrate/nitrite response regulator NarL
MTVVAPPARVVLVDDHALLAATLAAALRCEGYDVVIPTPGPLAGLRDAVVAEAPDVVLLDLDLGPFGLGADLIPLLRPSAYRVVVVSGTTAEEAIGECLDLGAAGWVPKWSSVDELLAAVATTLQGSDLQSPDERTRLIDLWRRDTRRRTEALLPFGRLSRWETEVLRRLVEGCSVGQVATDAFVSEATVRSQVRSVLMKLGVNSQLAAVALAIRAGWTGGDDRH